MSVRVRLCAHCRKESEKKKYCHVSLRAIFLIFVKPKTEFIGMHHKFVLGVSVSARVCVCVFEQKITMRMEICSGFMLINYLSHCRRRMVAVKHRALHSQYYFMKKKKNSFRFMFATLTHSAFVKRYRILFVVVVFFFISHSVFYISFSFFLCVCFFFVRCIFVWWC